tara:strand:- start:222 stop:1811 length:1590 start_codon:yes stop_codon:yes gene_type:complete
MELSLNHRLPFTSYDPSYIPVDKGLKELEEKYGKMEKEDLDEIEVLIKKVDNILNIENQNEDIKIVEERKSLRTPRGNTKLSSLDIYKFRLNNRNCLRCIALFTYPLLDSITPYNNVVKYECANEHNNVFTINDLFYSRSKRSIFSQNNFIQFPEFLQWFTVKFMNQMSIQEIVRKEVGNDIANYLTNPFPDNLMLNIFILFISLSDKISTLSMYTPIGDEPQYYYKTNSLDMKIILSKFNSSKIYILNELNKLLGPNTKKQESMVDKLNTLLDILKFKDANDSNNVNAVFIVTCFLQAYSEAYFGKQETNLDNTINNEFFQHYVVKFTLLTTMMVTLMKTSVKCTNLNCIQKPPLINEQKQISSTSEEAKRKSKILNKRKATAEANRIAARDAEHEHKMQAITQKELQKSSRDSRANMRSKPYPDVKPSSSRGGSTKIVVYLVKIEKIKELNKKLKKNKTKNKNKIEKNNKQIDELKIKIKKQKEKEKLKKQKEKKLEKEKLKKQKEKLKKQKEKKIEKLNKKNNIRI